MLEPNARDVTRQALALVHALGTVLAGGVLIRKPPPASSVPDDEIEQRDPLRLPWLIGAGVVVVLTMLVVTIADDYARRGCYATGFSCADQRMPADSLTIFEQKRGLGR